MHRVTIVSVIVDPYSCKWEALGKYAFMLLVMEERWDAVDRKLVSAQPRGVKV